MFYLCHSKNSLLLSLNGNSYVLLWAHCLLSCHWASHRSSIWFHLLYTPSPGPPEALFSPDWTVPALSASLSMTDAPVPYSPLWLIAGLAPACPCLICTVDPRAPDVLHQCWVERKGHLPSSAGSAFLSAAQEACCWFVVNLVSTRTPFCSPPLQNCCSAGWHPDCVMYAHTTHTAPRSRQCSLPAPCLHTKMHFFTCSLKFQACQRSWSANYGSDDW